jgi:hypothetical protein
MRNKRQIIPAAGLLATIAIAVYMVAQMHAQAARPVADYSNALTAEVRNAQAQVILTGQFVEANEEDDDVERKASLQATGVVPGATGQAEVEISRKTPADQEVEFSIRNVPAGATFSFVIDGAEVATATADQRGRAEVEFDVRTVATAGTR